MKNSPPAEKTRVTLSLPTSLVREIDERLVDGDTTRGAAIQLLLEAALHDLDVQKLRRQERDEWVRAWRDQPDTDEEFGWTTSSAALSHLAEIPWESDTAPAGGPTSQIRGDEDRSS